jgi:hypothetical protein
VQQLRTTASSNVAFRLLFCLWQLHALMQQGPVADLQSHCAGSLGFLTNHAFKDFRRDLHDVIHGGEGLEECSLPGEEIRVRSRAPSSVCCPARMDTHSSTH